MKKSALALFIALVAATASVSIAAVPPPAPPTQPAPPPPRGRAGRAGPPASLGQAMNDMNRTLTAVKAEVTDPSKFDQTLKDIATMQRDAAISKTLTPPSSNALTGDAKTKAAEDYRVMMVGLMKNLMALEDAVVAKKPDDVQKLIKELEDIETKGHAEFIKEG